MRRSVRDKKTLAYKSALVCLCLCLCRSWSRCFFGQGFVNKQHSFVRQTTSYVLARLYQMQLNNSENYCQELLGFQCLPYSCGNVTIPVHTLQKNTKKEISNNICKSPSSFKGLKTVNIDLAQLFPMKKSTIYISFRAPSFVSFEERY